MCAVGVTSRIALPARSRLPAGRLGTERSIDRRRLSPKNEQRLAVGDELRHGALHCRNLGRGIEVRLQAPPVTRNALARDQVDPIQHLAKPLPGSPHDENNPTDVGG